MAETPAPRLMPKLADVYREKVAALQDAPEPLVSYQTKIVSQAVV